MLRFAIVLALVVVCLPAMAQEALTLEAVQGTWYGWLAGTGMELKVGAMPDGAVAYLKTVQSSAQPFLQELRPSIENEEFVLESLQAPQAFTMRFHFEGEILFGTYSESQRTITIALARSMPDVEALFVSPAIAAEADPMRSARADGRRNASAAHLRQIGEALRAYATASENKQYPALNPIPGIFAPEAASLFPAYVKDATLFVASSHPNAAALRKIATDDPLVAIDDNSYWYLGYLVPNEEIAQAYLHGYAAAAAAGTFGDVLRIRGIEVPRLRVGIEQLLVSNLDDDAELADVAARIPVMIERPGLHDGGSNVLYLDGHVEFLPYPGPFPMTPDFIEGLQQLEAQFTTSGDIDEQDHSAGGRAGLQGR